MWHHLLRHQWVGQQCLQQWALVFPGFFNLPFSMIDFETTGGPLARIDVAHIVTGRAAQCLPGGATVRRPSTTFAGVLNTDVSTGRGKHWVSLFGDCRGTGEWTLEFFNSAGNAPPPAVARWLEESAARLRTLRASDPRAHGTGPVTTHPLTDIRHQDSQSECGLYCLFFIRARLEGQPASEFAGKRIPDADMTDFRQHVFREGGAA